MEEKFMSGVLLFLSVALLFIGWRSFVLSRKQREGKQLAAVFSFCDMWLDRKSFSLRGTLNLFDSMIAASWLRYLIYGDAVGAIVSGCISFNPDPEFLDKLQQRVGELPQGLVRVEETRVIISAAIVVRESDNLQPGKVLGELDEFLAWLTEHRWYLSGSNFITLQIPGFDTLCRELSVGGQRPEVIK